MKIRLNAGHSKMAISLLNINVLAEAFKPHPLPTEPITNIATLPKLETGIFILTSTYLVPVKLFFYSWQ